MQPDVINDLQFHFTRVDDPRVTGRCKHLLPNIIAMAVAAMIGGADDWETIADFANARSEFFGKVLGLEHGTPSHDTFSRVFSLIDTAQFEQCYRDWVLSALTKQGRRLLAIDGKSVRRSHDRSRGDPPLHIVSAYASEAGLVLTQQKVEEKSNEINAIPVLLDRLDLRGCTVSIDAMGCQKSIAAKIVDRGGEYVFGLKGNQPRLAEQVEQQFQEWIASNFTGAPVDTFEQSEQHRGRRELRRVWSSNCLGAIGEASNWPQLKSIVMIESIRATAEGETVEQRYYISSCESNAAELAHAIRRHWAIENSVHWVLDMTFNEDQSRVRERVAAENLCLLRKIAMNTVRADSTRKASLRRKRRMAGWDSDYLATLLKSMAV